MAALILNLDTKLDALSCLACFTHGVGGCEVATTGLGVMEKREISCSAGKNTAILKTSCLQANHYTD